MRLAILAVPLLLAACLTPLHKAAGEGNVAEINRLLAAGANPNVVNENIDKWTPLAHAAYYGQVEAIKALVAGGADPLFQCAAGTARQIAIAWNHPDAAEVLRQLEIQHGGTGGPVPPSPAGKKRSAGAMMGAAAGGGGGGMFAPAGGGRTGLMGAMAAPQSAPQPAAEPEPEPEPAPRPQPVVDPAPQPKPAEKPWWQQ